MLWTGRRMVRTNSLPWSCNWKTRLLVPDIIYCSPDDSLKFGYSITNVIEFGSETSAADKVVRFNESSRRMIEGGAQSGSVLPRIIFLYDRQIGVSIEDVKSMVSAVDTENLYNVVVDYYDEKGEWFREYFKE
jgi:hypothetical protein